MLPLSTALLLIDVQKAWDDPHWGARSHPQAESRIQELVAAFRSSGRPLLHIRQDSLDPHSPLYPGEPGHGFKPEGEPLGGERIVAKSSSSAFIGTELELILRSLGIDRLVIAGFGMAQDVSSTIRMAADLGFKVLMVQDALVAFELEDAAGQVLPPDQIHRVVLAELHGAFGVALEAAALLSNI